MRDRAVRLIAAEDAYAAVLISMHTYSLLHDHADRSTIAPEQLPLLDRFLEDQKALQDSLRRQIAVNPKLKPEHKSDDAILDHFHLLQANDNLSLLTCVDFQEPANLLHAMPTRNGKRVTVQVRSAGIRRFILQPYPFSERTLTFQFPARHAKGKLFSTARELQDAYNAAPKEMLSVMVSAD